MTAASFVDTNIFIYARDPRDLHKQRAATSLIDRLWQERAGRTSIQVLNEYYATITRKFKDLDNDQAWDYVLVLMAWNPQPIDRDVLLAAREIERRYRTSWWDATIVAAAQAQRCTLLISEDFQDGMTFGSLRVQNPFMPAVQEPPVHYVVPQPRPRHRARGRPAKSHAS